MDTLNLAEAYLNNVHRIWKEKASGGKDCRAEGKQVMALAQARQIDLILVSELMHWDLHVSLQADEPLRAGLLRVADALTQNAVDRIRCPSSDRAEDVHLVRVAIKRLRAMLRLIRPVISKTAFDRENARLRKAARCLSFARDSDVARQTLATLPLSKGRERDAGAAVLTGFNREPEAEIGKATDQVELDLEQTRRDLHRIRISGREWQTIKPGLTEVYRQCRKRMERALRQGDDEAFHKWRIRVKNLCYELQMLQPAWPARLNKMVSGLERLQGEIGADHDLVILKRSLRKTPDAFGGAETVEQLIDSLDHKSRKLRRVAEPRSEPRLCHSPEGQPRLPRHRW